MIYFFIVFIILFLIGIKYTGTKYNDKYIDKDTTSEILLSFIGYEFIM